MIEINNFNFFLKMVFDSSKGFFASQTSRLWLHFIFFQFLTTAFAKKDLIDGNEDMYNKIALC